jgi:hypothetical protein
VDTETIIAIICACIAVPATVVRWVLIWKGIRSMREIRDALHRRKDTREIG